MSATRNKTGASRTFLSATCPKIPPRSLLWILKSFLLFPEKFILASWLAPAVWKVGPDVPVCLTNVIASSASCADPVKKENPLLLASHDDGIYPHCPASPTRKPVPTSKRPSRSTRLKTPWGNANSDLARPLRNEICEYAINTSLINCDTGEELRAFQIFSWQQSERLPERSCRQRGGACGRRYERNGDHGSPCKWSSPDGSVHAATPSRLLHF